MRQIKNPKSRVCVSVHAIEERACLDACWTQYPSLVEPCPTKSSARDGDDFTVFSFIREFSKTGV